MNSWSYVIDAVVIWWYFLFLLWLWNKICHCDWWICLQVPGFVRVSNHSTFLCNEEAVGAELPVLGLLNAEMKPQPPWTQQSTSSSCKGLLESEASGGPAWIRQNHQPGQLATLHQRAQVRWTFVGSINYLEVQWQHLSDGKGALRQYFLSVFPLLWGEGRQHTPMRGMPSPALYSPLGTLISREKM